ncbi:methyltransferase domain-containing protein [Paenibacillus sp. MBLB2552]|uniref:Methyltransferase domain-containing protein n=1 Tax=Paenibacillus mellifer TaxID=2937794 RepID=A0A9X1Y504_9BACL|nr:class I SAM-dependent methyltransferase [Paenibacillus mellifer]MCK8487402.1 methyltransferase domain-containing protein [Paenibacillus mellifer]
MPIDFHDRSNQSTYASRAAEVRWIKTIEKYVSVQGKHILDLGCGGGIYSKVFSQAGASHVTAMDYSSEMLKGAIENCKDLNNITFIQGSALETKLEKNLFDVLLERALIHHIENLRLCFQEAQRILKPNGRFIIQDRTAEDCSLPGSNTHIRGYFFEKYPQLLETETSRRYTSDEVLTALKQTGFNLIIEMEYWETRKIYSDFEELKNDLLNRTGRSILHELSDEELVDLTRYIQTKIENNEQIIEEDRWTVWIAEK